MDIAGHVRVLGPVAAGPLRERILAQSEQAWQEDEYRQKSFEVHRDTLSMVLLFLEKSSWPDIVVSRRPGWDRLSNVANPLMESVIAEHYPPGGRIVRAMAAKLKAGGKITPHRDSHPSFHLAHRIHIPITANPRVRFTIDGRPVRLSVGGAFEINNQQTHSVYNKGREDRISFIFDYLPPGKMPPRSPH